MLSRAGQHLPPDVPLRPPAKDKHGWGLIFKQNPGLVTCGNSAENLGIAAFDVDGDGATDRWEITTDTSNGPTKIACLARTSPSSTTFAGYVELQSGYTIERLP